LNNMTGNSSNNIPEDDINGGDMELTGGSSSSAGSRKGTKKKK